MFPDPKKRNLHTVRVASSCISALSVDSLQRLQWIWEQSSFQTCRFDDPMLEYKSTTMNRSLQILQGLAPCTVLTSGEKAAYLSCKVKAMNLFSGFSQSSSYHVMSSGVRNSVRPSSGCCFLNLISSLHTKLTDNRNRASVAGLQLELLMF